jgi:ribonucleoside-diphosphate reductase beta chain
MNSEDMTNYIKYVADELLVRLGVEKEYNAVQPFPFMYKIALDKKTNFFERKVAEYTKPTGEITFDNDDF